MPKYKVNDVIRWDNDVIRWDFDDNDWCYDIIINIDRKKDEYTLKVIDMNEEFNTWNIGHIDIFTKEDLNEAKIDFIYMKEKEFNKDLKDLINEN